MSIISKQNLGGSQTKLWPDSSEYVKRKECACLSTARVRDTRGPHWLTDSLTPWTQLVEYYKTHLDRGQEEEIKKAKDKPKEERRESAAATETADDSPRTPQTPH
eukprot:scaffold127321_cov26-Tisochrysis_lutea.AAC.1